MKYKALLLVAAQKDVQEASRWYNQKQKGLGRQLVKEVREKIKFIEQHPFTFGVRYGHTRTATLDRFPYMIHYRIEENSKKILIGAVFHTRQDHAKWEERIEQAQD